MRTLDFSSQALDDLKFWGKNEKTLDKIDDLIEDILKTPFTGIGRPELLKHDFSGCWSRQINKKDRLIYKVTNDKIIIVSCRYHYS